MLENNFEKQVQEKLGDLGLSPTPAVWQSVELAIRQKKKRRVIIFWVLAALLAGGSIYSILFFTANKHQPLNYQNNKSLNPDSQTVQPRENDDAENKIVVQQDSLQLTDKTVTPSRPDSELNRQIIKNPGDNKNISSSLSISSNQSIGKNKKKIKEPVFIQEDQTKVTQALIPKKDQEKNKELAGKEDEKNTTKVNEPFKPGVNEAVKKTSVEDSIKVSVDNSSQTAALKKTNTTKTSSWSFAISAGRSAIVNSLQLFKGKVAMDFLAQPSGGPAIGGNPVNYLKPSFSLSAGLIYKKALSTKLDLNAGFNYQLLTTSINAGTKIDSTRIVNNSYSQGIRVSNYFRPNTGDSRNYTNQYHFLSLSGELSWKIIDKEKFDLSWNNGISFNRLVSSSMLHYDYAAGIYYKDNDRLKKNQLFFNTGLEIPVSRKISVSPFAAFSLTSVFKRSDSAFRYSNYGLQLRIRLNNK